MMDDSIDDQMGTPANDLGPQSNKRRRKKSIVWDHFTVEPVSAGCTRACCKLCKKSFAYITGSKVAGTSHLRRHITLGICPVRRHNQEQNGLSINTPASRTVQENGTDSRKRNYRGTSGSTSVSFDPDECNHALAKMIMRHEHPLQIVEQPGFIDFVRTLQPKFNVSSFNALQDDCVSIYLREKQALLSLLCGIPGRVSLTLDLLASSETLGYVLLTAHFIDGDWNLHRRVLTVSALPCSNSDIGFEHSVVACLMDWSLDSRLFSLTVDSSFSNESVVRNLRGLLSVKNPFLFNGQLVNINCYARVLGRLAHEATQSVSETIGKIRESVTYVKISKSREVKFAELKHRLQVPSTKDLLIDDLTKWDTTYHMLVAACELKEIFSCLDAADSGYKESPSMDEWKQIETLCMFLKLLFDSASILLATTYPTANTFFHEVWKIHAEFTHASMSQDPFISELIKPLQEMFDRYWRGCCLVLATAVVMDPRFKMKLVEFSFSKIYGEDADAWIKIVDDNIRELFLEYLHQTFTLPTNFEDEPNDMGTTKVDVSEDTTILGTVDGLSDFEIYISELSNGHEMKSELDQYLEESLLPRVQEFDVLRWWNLNKLKYPTLSKMASDILTIPMSTVAPDCVFDTVRKNVSSYHTSLGNLTLESLICGKDWLRQELPEFSTGFSNAIVKIEI